MKRIIAAVITLTLCLCCVSLPLGNTTAHAATTYQRNTNAAALLNSLDILRGDESGNLMLEKKVTRAEFTALIIRTLGLEDMAQSMVSEDQIFQDVGKDHWALGYVALSKQMGLIDGMSKDYFGADRFVSFTEAVKITVCALGYREIAESKGGYPQGYEQTAISIDLLRDVPVQAEMSRQASCNLLYNALTARIHNEAYEEKGNLLTKYLNFKVAEGKVTATYNYQKESPLDLSEIEIDGAVYKCKSKEADSYIGMSVEYYTRRDGGIEDVVYHIVPIGTATDIVVLADDISPSTTLSQFIYYDKDNKKRTANIDSVFTAYYNGKVIPSNSVTVNDIKIESGMITLRDADGNGRYETLLIDAYKDYVVNYVTEDAIYAKFGEKLTLTDSIEESLVVEKNGKVITLSDIQNGDILSVVQSRDSKKTKILVSNERSTGYITQIETDASYKDTYLLEQSDGLSVSFNLAQNYRKALANNHIDAVKLTLSNQRLVRIYYNSFGLVSDVAVLTDEDGYDYGFLNAAGLSGAFKEHARFEMLTTANRFEIFDLTGKDKITFGRRIHGQYKISKETPETIVNSLTTKQIIKFKLDKDGIIDEIYRADSVTSNEHFSIGPEAEGTQMNYRDNVFGLKYYIDQNTAVFSINKAGEYKHIMSAGKYTTFLKNGDSKYCTFYDMEGSYAKVLVMNAPTVNLFETDADGYEVILDYVNSSLLYIDDIVRKTDENGEIYTCLNGYQDGEPYSIYVAETLEENSEARANLRPGTVIQYEDNDIFTERAVNSDEPKQLILFKTVYDFNAPQAENILWDYKPIKSTRPQISTLWGTVVSATDNGCTLNINGENYTVSIHENTMILKYDYETKRFVQEKAGSVNVGQRVFIRQRYLNTREIVIY